MRTANGSDLSLLVLSLVRMGTVRVTTPQLFPEASPLPAKSLPVLDSRARDAVFYEQTVRSMINPPESTGMGFWSINPYVGCEFGCTYCYARFTHHYVVERAESAGRLGSEDMGSYRGDDAWKAFEHRIFVKRRDAALAAIERDLVRVRRRRDAGEEIEMVLGTSTDPYQPAERKYGLSRAILQRLAQERGISVRIISKSPLVCRDIDVLAEIQRHNHLSIHVSLITTDVRLIKQLEARSPMPHARLRALSKLATAGLSAGLIVAPVLPGINDTVTLLDALVAAGKQAGARFAHAAPLRLYSSIREHFFPVLERHFPSLAAKYRAAYRGFGHAPMEYAAALGRRFRRIARRHGIPIDDRSSNDSAAERPRRSPKSQLGLWSAT